MNILIVEDEARVADFIQRGLRSEGWSVTAVSDAESGLELVNHDSFDAVILDLMLPGMSGQDMCRELRTRKNLTPVLMLTALGARDDRVAGLRMGADDYLAKPFDFDELVARLEALARRHSGFQTTPQESHRLEVASICFDTETLDVTCDGHLIDLTSKERDILALFLRNPGKVFSRERILNTVWCANADPLTNVVDVYMGRLRKKLGPEGRMVETVRGAGYRLIAR